MGRKWSKGRYATLTAVVGVSFGTDRERSFMESYGCRSEALMHSGRVRLVGVGRAALTDFFYKLSADVSDGDEEEEEEDVRTPIVMTAFEPVLDDGVSSRHHSFHKGPRSARASPVHTLAALNQLKNKISRLHEQRKKLVAGLTAARARLRFAYEKETLALGEEDRDGLGSLGRFSSSYYEVDQFLARFPPGETSHAQNLAATENYGLNAYCAFSTLPALTHAATEMFEPYYSDRYREREEFEYEVLSFVALRAVQGIASREDEAWALKCTCTEERLERVYEIMMEHKFRLKQLSEKVSRDLADCGEECTDLW